MADRIGEQLGNYRLTRLLGRGGFADVYLGEHVYLKTHAAIKILHTQLTEGDLQGFLQEAQTIAHLEHPHIVRILEFGMQGNTPFLVMSYASGGTLRTLHPKGSIVPLTTIIAYIKQSALALQHAHDQKLIHRDIKPENLLLGRTNELLVSDFGIAAVAHSTTSLKTGAYSGTVHYSAPEQITGKPRPASDQYSLGIIVYEWLTGTRPFSGTSHIEIAMHHLSDLPPPLRNKVPSISPDIEQVVLQALAKDPEQRFASVQAFATALEQAVQSMQATAVAKPVAGADRPLSTPPKGDDLRAMLAISPEKAPTIPSPNGALLFQESVPGPPQKSQEPQLDSDNPSIDSKHHQEPPDDQQRVATAPLSIETSIPISYKDDSIKLPQTLGETISRSPIPVAQPNPPTVLPTPKQRNTRKMIAVGAASMAAWVAARGRIARSGRVPLITIVLVLLALVVFGTIAIAVPGIFPSTTVTITPASADLKHTYTISAVTGTPNPSQQQVEARQLSSSAPVQSKTITATGSGQNPGVQAIGTLTVFNANFQAQTVPKGTVLTDSNGIEVITADTALIPPAMPPNEGSVTVNARAVKAGASGNIAARDFNNVPCCNIAGVTAQNTAAFAGGQDGSSYTFVQQSDIDGVATPLEASAMQTAQAALQSQVRSNEQIADHPQCTPTVTSDHQVGEKAPRVTVTVKVTCTAEAYDHQGTLSMAENLLKQEAAKSPGPAYALIGNLVTTVTQTTVTDPTKGTLSVLVKAEGVWVYQFSDAQKQALAKLIAGKKTHDAQTLLSQQPSVTKADIQLPITSGNTFPADPNQITIVVLSVPGAQGPATTPMGVR